MQPKGDEILQRVGKSKVTKLKANADNVYPLIRLPKAYADEIGKTAEIFEAWDGSKRALFITFEGRPEPAGVIQYSAKVIQPDSSNSIENRLRGIESEIKEF
jgi:hypothetical protein